MIRSLARLTTDKPCESPSALLGADECVLRLGELLTSAWRDQVWLITSSIASFQRGFFPLGNVIPECEFSLVNGFVCESKVAHGMLDKHFAAWASTFKSRAVYAGS